MMSISFDKDDYLLDMHRLEDDLDWDLGGSNIIRKGEIKSDVFWGFPINESDDEAEIFGKLIIFILIFDFHCQGHENFLLCIERNHELKYLL
ncbi:hypothetical protein O3M35_000846 [Rhynocoris fuscipes]|uniref:Uncharacterized protein n=1 Tax=Rhynocoris fuscipes TaxID=488301 RepID=A0AAW1DQC2_9HEMI